MQELKLDPRQKYLRKEGEGTIFPWTRTLAKRPDMRPFNPVTMEVETDFRPVNQAPLNQVPLVLQEETFKVDPLLKDMVDDLLRNMDILKAENAQKSASSNEDDLIAKIKALESQNKGLKNKLKNKKE